MDLTGKFYLGRQVQLSPYILKGLHEMNRLKVVVIDSGVESEHSAFQNHAIEGIRIYKKDGAYKTDFNIEDIHGHGTAIVGILSHYVEVEEIFSIKIYDENLESDIDKLLFALNYIKDHLSPVIIHMSLGSRIYDKRLEDACSMLSSKGYLIISAYDNNGGMSFPATFESVIGVDTSYECVKKNEFIYVDNSPVNILAKGGYHRIPWINNRYILNQGTSFSAAYITGQLAKWLTPPISFEIARQILKRNAMKIYEGGSYQFRPNQRIPFKIGKVAVIPYNKEVHSILNFEDLLDFKVVAYYDIIKRTPSGSLKKSIRSNKEIRIENYNKIDWSAFDTLVIGHLQEISTYLHQDIKKVLLEKCIENRKNVFCFDDILVSEYRKKFEKEGVHIYAPIKDEKSTVRKGEKLYHVSCPVLGVWGTSTAQGKFTLQLYLRKLFMDNGYNVGQVGTEPTSLLFGMDDSFPFGYNSSVNILDKKLIESVNESLFYISKQNKDIIITGSQSGTVPMYYNNVEQLHLTQLEFLIGTNPDLVILCVNLFDDIAYIRRTILAIESIVDCRVISIVVSPMVYANDWQILSTQKKVAEDEEIELFKDRLIKDIKRPVYTLGVEEEMEQLFQCCIDFLA